jgi:hypothetical protein
MYENIMACPNCKGNGWDPHGGVCEVCQGAGALYRGDASPAKHEDADAFFDYYREMRYATKERNYGE